MAEANRLNLAAIDEKVSSMKELETISGGFSYIELLCAEDTINAAKDIFTYLAARHTERDVPIKGYTDLRRKFIDSLKKEIGEYK